MGTEEYIEKCRGILTASIEKEQQEMGMGKSKILEMTIETLWPKLEQCQGQIFYTAKKLPFTYEIRGGEMFVDRRSKSITRATFQRALEKIQENPEKVTGPKSLNMFGAPYIMAILRGIESEAERQE